MSRYRFHGELTLDTQAHFDVVKSRVETQLASMSGLTWTTDQGRNDEGKPIVMFDLHFDDWNVRDQFKEWITTQINQNPVMHPWLLGIWGAWHKAVWEVTNRQKDPDYSEFSL